MAAAAPGASCRGPTLSARTAARVSYTLVEPCSGGAAFSLHLCGARRALLPYQGNKWRFRHGLQRRAEALGFVGRPARIALTDPGPWGRTMAAVLDPADRPALVARLRALAAEDPRAVFERLHGGPVPAELAAFAAEHLFLQRLAFSGKAVGCRGGRWMSPGLNVSSAYGLPATDRFGAVQPMVPSLLRVLDGYDVQLAPVDIDVRQVPAVAPTGPVDGRVLVYLDPPYDASTRYPDGAMTRAEVVALAEAWRAAGAAVMVSEQHSVELAGWGRGRLDPGRRDTSPFRGQQEEWLTFAAPVRP